MSLSEFELIRRFFTRCGPARPDVILGVGDDCALLQVPNGKELAVTIDTLVEGVHFYAGADPDSLGHKALAVNLSDLAAMGAEPAWVTLALTLPRVDEGWLTAFARGFSALAADYQIQLVGGDTTRGPLTISVQAHGFVAAGAALRRRGARPGDLIYVTGTLGDAGLALRAQQEPSAVVPEFRSYLWSRLERPSPRVVEGQALVGLASAAIDISDGLVSDLGHICEDNELGARVNLEALPLSAAVKAYVEATDDWSLVLSSGDDYELCLTIPPSHQAEAERIAADFACGLTRIGVVEATTGLRCVRADGSLLDVPRAGYQHFEPNG